MSNEGKIPRRSPAGRHAARREARGFKTLALALALALLAGAAVGGTVAWLTSESEEVVNKFEEADVPNVPVEEFDGEAKTSIVVKNEGNVDAYVRVKLVTYRVDDAGNHIGGEAPVPSFGLGDGWFKQGGYYYYMDPVASGGGLSGDLIAEGSKIELEEYDDADGGKQVIEVISESIQSLPAGAVEDAWGAKVVGGKLTAGN